MQELPRLSWGCVHKCSLCACALSPSVLSLQPIHAYYWAVGQHMCKCSSACDCTAYCKSIQRKAMKMWLSDLTEQCSEHWKFVRLDIFLFLENGSIQALVSHGRKPQTQTCANIDKITFQETQMLRLGGSKTVSPQNYAVHGDYGSVKCWHEQGLL